MASVGVRGGVAAADALAVEARRDAVSMRGLGASSSLSSPSSSVS